MPVWAVTTACRLRFVWNVFSVRHRGVSEDDRPWSSFALQVFSFDATASCYFAFAAPPLFDDDDDDRDDGCDDDEFGD